MSTGEMNLHLQKGGLLWGIQLYVRLNLGVEIYNSLHTPYLQATIETTMQALKANNEAYCLGTSTSVFHNFEH